jgi:hypothetical protein
MKRAFYGVGLGLGVLALGIAPARAQEDAIPTDGLELWVKADGQMTVANAQITQWTDLSSKGNNAIHDAFGQATPTLATANGQPTLRWSGVYSGFHFTQITTIRTVFAVLSKDSTSCLPTLPNYGTSAKFWLGGNADPTYFHPQHGCCIYNTNLSEVSPNLVNGKTYLNGKLIDGRTTQFPLDELGLLSIVALANVSADTIGRDRNFQDRSWQGNISELLIYSKPLDDATRGSIENILAKKYAIAAAGGGSTDGGVVDVAAGGTGGAGGTTGAGGATGVGEAGGHTAGVADAVAGWTNAGGGAVVGAGGAAEAGSGGGADAGTTASVGGTAGTPGGTGGTAGAAAGGTTAGMGGALSTGGPGDMTGAGGITGAGGDTGTGAVTGGAPADAAVGGTPPHVSAGNNSTGCSCGVARGRDGRVSGLFVLLGTVLALLLRGLNLQPPTPPIETQQASGTTGYRA